VVKASVTRVNPDWRNAESIELVRSPAGTTGNRRYLVYVAASENAGVSQAFLCSNPRTFDLAVRYYAQPGTHDPLYETAEYVLTGGLSKLHSAARFLQGQNLLDRYDGYLFLDGDIEFDCGDLDRLFAFTSAFHFDLAQAALIAGSHSSWYVTGASRAFVCRETSFVEIMAPYFSRAALKAVLPTFDQSISGYGLDFAWPAILEGNRIGVVDQIGMRHIKRIDLLDGAFYRYLRSISVDPQAEQDMMLKRYGMSRFERPHDIAGYVMIDEESRDQLLRVPLARVPRMLASFMRWQDRPAIQVAKLFNSGKRIQLAKPLP